MFRAKLSSAGSSAGTAQADIDEPTVAGDRDSQHQVTRLSRGVAHELLMLRKLLRDVPEILVFHAPLAVGIRRIDESRRLPRGLLLGGRARLRHVRQRRGLQRGLLRWPLRCRRGLHALLGRRRRLGSGRRRRRRPWDLLGGDRRRRHVERWQFALERASRRRRRRWGRRRGERLLLLDLGRVGSGRFGGWRLGLGRRRLLDTRRRRLGIGIGSDRRETQAHRRRGCGRGRCGCWAAAGPPPGLAAQAWAAVAVSRPAGAEARAPW